MEIGAHLFTVVNYLFNLGAVLSVMLRLVMNPEGCAECLWHVEILANTKIMVGVALLLSLV